MSRENVESARAYQTSGNIASWGAIAEGKDDMGKRFAIVLGVAAAGVMALGAQATPPSDIVKYDTKLRITADSGFKYHGWVKSEVRKCERGRWVTLLKQRPGADRRLGTDRTGGRGGFDSRDDWGIIEAHGVQHRVYAKVRPKVRDRFVCRADRAPNTGTFR